MTRRTFDVTVEGWEYHEGSSQDWRWGSESGTILAESRAEAILELLENLGQHGDASDAPEWVGFDDENELVIRVTPSPDPQETT